MKVLIACEESQTVCKAFRAKGHEAYSCDIIEPSGGHPEWHILGDALVALNGGVIITMDGVEHDVGKWDMLIAHPPCTYLTVTGNSWFDIEKYGDAARRRYKSRYEAIVFFMHFALADCERIAVENPVGIMSTAYRKPDCIVQPYMFGDACLAACAALDKQIPKKPRETRCALMCASCGHKITEKGCKKLHRNYCKKCGQRILWED